MENIIKIEGVQLVELAGKVIDKVTGKELTGLCFMGMLTFATVAIFKEM
ncbi:MAG: hypothetical protein HUJ56_13030 [Erysipelotrichaceae bacterium]|nr:hypothetical protein [Erysipelotrichaceae bacterium]